MNCRLNPTQKYNIDFFYDLFSKEGIYFDGLTVFRGRHVVSLVNDKKKSCFNHEQAELIKSVGGVFNINFNCWLIEI